MDNEMTMVEKSYLEWAGELTKQNARLLAVARAAATFVDAIEDMGRGKLKPQLCDTEEWIAASFALAAVEDLL